MALHPQFGEDALKQCSRPVPEGITGVWQVEPHLLRAVERDLPKLSGVKAQGCCIAGASMRDATQFYRQYLGVTVGGRRLVYVNAFLPLSPGQHEDRWRKEFVGACDGGERFWGALYDPATGEFSQLAFNGRA